MSETTAIQTATAVKPSAIAAMASRLEVEPEKLTNTLTNTVFKGASKHELLALVVTANEYQLNPLLKEMYAFPAKGGGIVPVVGIDGWLKIINRQPNFDGMKVTVSQDGSEATCEIYLKDRKHPIEVTEYLDECKRTTEPWKMMPKRMLRHKAIMQAGRVAFGIGGIQDEDEAKDSMRNVTPARQTVEIRDDYKALAKSEQSTVDEAPKKEESPNKAQRNVVVRDVKEKECSNKSTRYTVRIDLGGKVFDTYTFSKRVGANAKALLGCEGVADLDYDPESKQTKLVEINPKNTQQEGEIC